LPRLPRLRSVATDVRVCALSARWRRICENCSMSCRVNCKRRSFCSRGFGYLHNSRSAGCQACPTGRSLARSEKNEHPAACGRQSRLGSLRYERWQREGHSVPGSAGIFARETPAVCPLGVFQTRFAGNDARAPRIGRLRNISS
jgi:hypothetical protein